MNSVPIPEGLYQKIKSEGLEPPSHLIPGKKGGVRFPGKGKGAKNTAAWCFLSENLDFASFGDYSSGGVTVLWFAEDKNLRINNNISQRRKSMSSKKVAAEKAVTAQKIWNESSPMGEHDYLTRKKVKLNGARIHENGSLVIPIFKNGKVVSLQFVDSNDNKKFLSGAEKSGGFFTMGEVEENGHVCLAEGFSTAASIYESTGYPTVVSFGASRLLEVGKTIKADHPNIELIVCADNDAQLENGNIGLEKAKETASSLCGHLAIPIPSSGYNEKINDFNDLANQYGREEVKKIINSSMESLDLWDEPLSVFNEEGSKEFPIEALPHKVRLAVEEVHKYVQAPIPLIVHCALGNLSLAAQAYADVEIDSVLSSPISLFLLTIADSGERKSSCDRCFSKVIDDYEKEQIKDSEESLKEWRVKEKMHEIKKNKIESEFKNLGKKKIDSNKNEDEKEIEKRTEEDLLLLEKTKPIKPRVPRLKYMDITPESLREKLSKEWPSGGIMSSEGGLVFGSHGMNQDTIMRNLATYNEMWDGGKITTDRKTAESSIVYGARLTMSIQIQEETLRSFLAGSKQLAKGTGFLSRFFITHPTSTQGRRFYKNPPKEMIHLDNFNECIKKILKLEVPFDDNGTLCPKKISFSSEAKKSWIKSHNEFEEDLGEFEKFFSVQDTASKAANNVARLACLFEIIGYGELDEVSLDRKIDVNSIEGASEIVRWHLHEATRFYDRICLFQQDMAASKLNDWMVKKLKEKIKSFLPGEIYRIRFPIVT